MFLQETHAVLSFGKLYHWTSGQNHNSPKKARELIAMYQTTSSSTTQTPTSSSSSSRDSVFDESRYTENPVPERSGGTSEELRGNLQHKPTETENKNKNERSEEVQSDPVHDLPDWLQEFRKNLVDESGPLGDPAPGHRDTAISSHDAQCVFALSEGTILTPA